MVQDENKTVKTTGNEVRLVARKYKQRQRKEIKAVTVSQTEQIWWPLKLPSLLTSFDSILFHRLQWKNAVE